MPKNRVDYGDKRAVLKWLDQQGFRVIEVDDGSVAAFAVHPDIPDSEVRLGGHLGWKLDHVRREVRQLMRTARFAGIHTTRKA